MKTPASELTPQQLETLKAQLEAAKLEILGRGKPAPAARVQERAEVGDAMDAADRAAETEESGARNERDAARLADIEHALGKFATHEYGLSEDSGEPIGFGRLQALPWARFTVAEEELREKR